MKIVVVGGGPSGLYLALLVKKRQPQWSVQVFEQNAANATFGFGVVLADTGLNRLCAADVATHNALVARMTFNDRQALVHERTAIMVKRPKLGGAIARIDLLDVLQRAAMAAGVEVRFNARLDATSTLDDADLIVGADGINSLVRGSNEAGFGTTRSVLENRFAWFGTTKVFPNPALVFRSHRGGAFVAHYYPYSSTHSTFVAECDAPTWELLGMEQMTDAARQALFEEIYAEELDGHALIANAAPGASPWRQFPVIHNRSWATDRSVLIGDAQTSAHFSIGSGTRIAMEDSIALADALVTSGAPIATRLANFVAARSPEKNKLIDAAERSYNWYERLGDWIRQYNAPEFVYAFMTRTGRVDDARLAAQFPDLMKQLGRASA